MKGWRVPPFARTGGQRLQKHARFTVAAARSLVSHRWLIPLILLLSVTAMVAPGGAHGTDFGFERRHVPERSSAISRPVNRRGKRADNKLATANEL